MSKNPDTVLRAERLVREVLTETFGQKADAETIRGAAEKIAKMIPSRSAKERIDNKHG